MPVISTQGLRQEDHLWHAGKTTLWGLVSKQNETKNKNPKTHSSNNKNTKVYTGKYLKKKKHLFYVYVPECVHICVPHVSCRGHNRKSNPWSWSYGRLGATLWMLGIKCRSSTSTASALTWWVISAAPEVHIFTVSVPHVLLTQTTEYHSREQHWHSRFFAYLRQGFSV